MSDAITLYGCPTCEDTDEVRAYLTQHGIPFREINLDEDDVASAFVIFLNGGFRSTPTLVFGDDKRKLILTEPNTEMLNEALSWAGYR